MAIPFVKMQGLGNDFVVIDDLGKPKALCHKITPELARRICDRRLGVGADQLLWLKSPEDPSSGADARMEILNADGSVAEMCGNGIRAVALYLYRRGPKRKPGYRIETLAGVKDVGFREGLISVDMGVPKIGPEERLTVGGREIRFFAADLGNPHAVIFVEDLAQAPAAELGPLMEVHPRFPRKTNVEFVEVVTPGVLKVRVWERGAGLTLACGTGACAAAVVAQATGRANTEVEVRLPGGALTIRWNAKAPSQGVIMEGPAEEVFRGEFLE